MKNTPHFMQPKVSLPYSQLPATCPYPQPAPASPNPHIPFPNDLSLYYPPIYARERLRWSRGSVLAFSIQVHGFKPGRSRQIFKGKKILSTPSFGGEVKPSVPCHRFAACKRSLNGMEVVISAKLPDNILAHSSTFRR